MKLTVVGCSGSFPGPDSAASCYLIEAQDGEQPDRVWRIVVDLGSGSLGPLQRLVNLRDIDAVMISHLHPDHFMDLCGLYVARRYDPVELAAAHDGSGAPGPGVPLLVYGPEHTADRLLQAYGPDAVDDLPRVYDVRELVDGGQVAVGPVTITSRLVEHPVTAFGMRFEHDGRVITYSGDTDACPSLLDLAQGADLLLAEASYQEGRDEARGVHLTGRRAGQIARDAGARRLVLTHIPVWTRADVVLDEAAMVYSGPLEVAVAGAGYVLEDVRVR